MSPPGLSKEQTAYDDGPLYHPDLSPLLLLFLTAKNQLLRVMQPDFI